LGIAIFENGLTLEGGKGLTMRAMSIVFAMFLATAAWAEDAATPLFIDGGVEDLSQFVWEKRPIVVFADSPNDPAFKRQIDLLHAREGELAKRDVVVIIDTDAQSPLRRKLRPRGFALVLIGKDGGIKLRKPKPWDVREISRVIDKMPLRQQEIRERGLGQ
jgi:hypothetical protein